MISPRRPNCSSRSAGSRWNWSGSKKKLTDSPERLRLLVDPAHPDLSIRRQCELIGPSRSSYYHEPAGETAENLALMRLIDRAYTDSPFFGSREMAVEVSKSPDGTVCRKRIRRLMRLTGLEAIYPKPNPSKPCPGHRIYPYLPRGVSIERVDQVWSTDITYVPMCGGFMYLAAVIDRHGRCVLSWRLSNTLDGTFRLEMIGEALEKKRPEVFNTDQGVQFTARSFTGASEEAGVRVSMDGRGRCPDNVFVERLWRSVKYENIYIRGYENVPELARGLGDYFEFYNRRRPHQSLGYRTPAEVHEDDQIQDG